MNLTDEQLKIIESESDELFIIARAGTGKTTTLIQYAKYRPRYSFLYLAYNTAVKKEADKKFFGNTEVHTIHSLAFKHIGHLYKDKLSENFRLIDIIFGVNSLNEEYQKDKSNQELFSIANKVMGCLNLYFSSKHKFLNDLEPFFPDEEILSMANEYFSKMQDFNSDVKMTHEGYLKLFQMTDPELNYDYIMIDEAQDSNEVFLEIIKNQNTKKIFVGDNYQSIYGFRNIVNVFNDLDSTSSVFYLTKSFRFGSQISFFVNLFLKEYKKEEREIIGLKEGDALCYLEDEKRTVITRTNAHLFDLAVQYVQLNQKIHIIGGENFIFNEMLDAMHLYKGDLFKIKSFHIKEFKSFAKLKIIAEKTKDQELIFLVKVIEKYKNNIDFFIDKIRKSLVKERNADIVLTTTHKSKGLEFFNVKLANDFTPLFTKHGHKLNPESINQEEVNIYYVAMTRAIEKLEINDDLEKFLSA